jgi:hypothetical protein
MKYLLGLAVITVAATASASVDQKNICAPRATGVPTREGPPKWVAWTGTNTIPADTSLDDPRWVGSTGQSFALGSAKAPLQTRILFGTDGASGAVTKYLYLSFVVDLSAFDTSASHPSAVTPRNVWLAFHRPAGHGGTEAGYLFQLHLTGTSTGTALAPAYCNAASACPEDAAGVGTDYWRLFVDKNHSGASGCTGALGRSYEPLTVSGGAPPIGWMTGGGQDAVRYWKLPATSGDPLHALNRWAVQIRIPMIAPVAGTTSPIATGIEIGSTMFYELTAKLAGPGLGNFAPVGWFPQTVSAEALCPNLTDDVVIHEQLGDAGAGCPGCDPNYFSVITDLGAGGTHPACPAGLDLDADHIGTVFNAPLPADHEAVPVDRTFGARDTTTPNHVVALPVNNSTDTIIAPIMARFRLAGWGSQPWSDSNDLGTWKDIRGSGTGVCATPPPAPPDPDANALCGKTSVAPGKHALVTFDWTIGGDATLGASEYCQFGLTPPSAAEACDTGAACSCPECGAAGGTRAHKAAGGFWPCVPKVYKDDQCLLVELSSPNGAALFEHQSVRSNMRFANLSTTAREALIDARKLPVGPGQKFQDIYLVAMPRNMPRSVPPTTTSVALAQEAALGQATAIAAPYLQDLERIPAPDLQRIAAQLGPPVAMANVREDDKRLRDLRRARAIMPPVDRARLDALVNVAVKNPDSNTPSQTLVRDAVSKLGSSTAADILPTLEIYPFYQPLGKGPAYVPMTSFSLFLSHESTLSGMTYAIDGAEQVSANVFHLRIPVGFARRIQVRAQALVGTEPPLAAGRPKWPCGTCCSQRCGLVASLGNTVPGMLAGIFVVGGRRRRRRR